VEEHVDVPARETERGGDVLAGTFFEHSHQHHGALGRAQAVDARAQAHALLRVGHQGLRGRRGVDRIDGIERAVRAGEMVTPSHVSRGVDHDSSEECPVLGRIVGKGAADGELQERAEGVVHAVERIFGAEPLTPREA
jgi:hypothetical protein